VIETVNNVTDSLTINPKIAQDKQIEFKKIFKKEYISPERPKEPKVDAELKLQLKDVQPFHFSPRRLAYTEREQLQKILDELLAKEVIRPSNSEQCVSDSTCKQKKRRVSFVYRLQNIK